MEVSEEKGWLHVLLSPGGEQGPGGVSPILMKTLEGQHDAIKNLNGARGT